MRVYIGLCAVVCVCVSVIKSVPVILQRGVLYRSDSLGYRGHPEDLDCRVEAGSDQVPPTPAFPVSPATPYGRSARPAPRAPISTQECARITSVRCSPPHYVPLLLQMDGFGEIPGTFRSRTAPSAVSANAHFSLLP